MLFLLPSAFPKKYPTAIDDAHRIAVEKWTKGVDTATEWERYRNSDGGFDLSKESNLNAFISDVESGAYANLLEGAFELGEEWNAMQYCD